MPRSSKVLPFVILALCLFAPAAHAANFAYYRAITVTSTTSIASGTNSNFPMEVSSTFSSWASVSHSGHIQNLITAPNGDQEPADLVFATSSANCNGTPLNFETESYNSSTGALIDWVNVPSLSAGTAIYACYDDSGTTTDQSHPSSTWNSNYENVYHLPDGSTLNLKDSTSHAYNATDFNAAPAASGEIDGAASFNGSNQYLQASTTLLANAPYTFSAWEDLSVLTTGASLISAYPWSSGSDPWIQLGGGGYPWQFASAVDGTGASGGAWFLITGVYDGTHDILYKNGVQVGIGSASGQNAVSAINISRRGDGIYLYASIDEVNVLNTALTPSWVLTVYNNQSSPSTFYNVGSETVVPGGGAIAVFWRNFLNLFDW